MIKKNLNLYICMLIMLVFTVGYFVMANNVSYAFSYDEKDILYESKVDSILLVSKKYAEDNIDLFNEKDTIYVTVDTLLEKGYLLADDDDGNYTDPRSNVKNLNEIKIRIKKNGKKLETKIIS